MTANEQEKRASDVPTGNAAPSALDARAAAFVDAYFREGRNAAAACAAIGASPRKASKLMGDPAIAAEIERRLTEAAAAPSADVSLDTLIADARAAYEAAKASGNASAMVSATQLLARLVGLLDGAADAKPDAAVEAAGDTRHLARALLQELPAKAVRAIRHVMEAERVGQVVVSLDPQLAAMLGEQVRALYPNDAPAEADELDATVKAVGLHPDFVEAFPNGSTIKRADIVPERRALGEEPIAAVTKWAIIDSRGELVGYRRDRAAAVTLAQSLPSMWKANNATHT